MKLSIVIPCYNEEENLSKLVQKLERIKTKSIEIILVNNGSIDNSKAVLLELIKKKESLFRIVTIEQNIGYGFGIMSGVKQAKGDIISWTHSDLQTEPSDIIKALSIFNKYPDNNKYVLKGRRVGRNLFDSFFTYGMGLISSYLMGVKLSDINAQPKMFYRSFLKELKNTPHDFSLDLYVLYQAKIKGYEIIEYPVEFNKRILGDSKGGGTLKGKFQLIKRTWKYINELRKSEF